MTAEFDEAQRHELSRALLHHLNGGVHNATLALELVSRAAAEAHHNAGDYRTLADAGLRGLAQATRTLQLVSALWGLPPKPDVESSAELVDDAVHALRSCARLRGVDFESELDRVEATPLDFDQVVAMMIAALSEIGRVPASARLRMKADVDSGGSIAFVVEPRS